MKEELLEILPLGTGSGATKILFGEPSTSFCFLVNNNCRLMVDLGFGIAHSALNFFKEIPNNIYVTHNHLDHSGELPVVSQVLFKSGRKLNLWCSEEIEEKLKKYRLDEIKGSGINVDELINWNLLNLDEDNQIDGDVSIRISKSQHLEPCYGFILKYKGRTVLSYSADSGYKRKYYHWLASAPNIIVDGRRSCGL